MMRNRLLCAASEPWQRWAEAFPEGERLLAPPRGDELLADEVLWISTSWQGWQSVLAVFSALPDGSPRPRWVVMSLNPSEAEGLQALANGARGYCHLLASPEMLREVAAVVRQGGYWVGPDLMASFTAWLGRRLSAPDATAAPAVSLELLSPRERDVALAVARGLSNKEVARELDITERTVKAHLGTVFTKLGVRDRLHLVLLLGRPEA